MAGGWRHGLGVCLAGLGLLAAGSQLQGWLPGDHDEPIGDPHIRTGAVGDVIDLRTADVTVEEVTGSPAIFEYDDGMLSPGLWVVATYTVVAKQENTMIAFAELEDATGRVWALDGGRNQNRCIESPPDLAAHCAVYFEVPPDALPSLVLRLARRSDDTRFDVVAEVDLGLTRADAAEFADAEPIAVLQPTLGEEEAS